MLKEISDINVMIKNTVCTWYVLTQSTGFMKRYLRLKVLLPCGLSLGYTSNVVDVACSVPKYDFGTENSPE
jgi:hypothetical protein